MSVLALEAAQLGDIVCLDSDCDFGRAAVAALKQVFMSVGSPTAFAPAVAVLVRRAAGHEAKTHWPFSNYCCAWKDIGVDAQQLTAQLARAGGVYAPPPPAPVPSPTETIWSAAKILLWSAVGLTVLVGGAVAYSLVSSARRGEPMRMPTVASAAASPGLPPHPAQRALALTEWRAYRHARRRR